MDIYVKMSTGKTITVYADSIANVKQQIQELERIPPDQQLLIYSGIELKDRHCLRDYNIGNGSTIMLAYLNKPFQISFTINTDQIITRVPQRAGVKFAVDVQLPIRGSDAVKYDSCSESQKSSYQCLLLVQLKRRDREICSVALLKY